MENTTRLFRAIQDGFPLDSIRVATERDKRDSTRQRGCCRRIQRNGAEEPNARLDLVLELALAV